MTEIDKAKQEKIINKKDEIVSLLKAEILKQYFYSEGLYEYQVINNPEIMAAIKILNNEREYKKILK